MPEHVNQLINPDLHVISVHFPIALLFIGTAIELLAFLWRRSSFRVAGRWMILIGALSAIPTVTSGMYAARMAMGGADLHWAELKHAANLNSDQWRLLMRHIRYNVGGTELLMLLVIAWMGASDRVRQRGHFVYLLLLLGAVGLLSAGAWHGGELVYSQGTGVGLIKRPHSAAVSSASDPDHVDAGESAGSDQRARFVFEGLEFTDKQLTKFDNPLDIHAELAGWTVALAVVTLGISIRALWRNPNLAPQEEGASDDDIVNALAGKRDQRALLDEQPPAPEAALPAFAPAARFWLVAFVVALCTVWLGWTVAGPGSMKDAIEIFNDEMRARWHILMGTSIVVLTLILALVTRFARHNRLLVGGFSLLLALVLAMQIWLGLLLMFDGSDGPINHFNAPTTQSTVT